MAGFGLLVFFVELVLFVELRALVYGEVAATAAISAFSSSFLSLVSCFTDSSSRFFSSRLFNADLAPSASLWQATASSFDTMVCLRAGMGSDLSMEKQNDRSGH